MYRVLTDQTLTDNLTQKENQTRIQKKDKILRIIYPTGKGKRIQPAVHFPVIIEYIKNKALKKYGPELDVPNLQ